MPGQSTIKAKATIYCNICCIKLKRVKTIKVDATNLDEARNEAASKIENWKNSLNGKNCRTCQSIIDDLK